MDQPRLLPRVLPGNEVNSGAIGSHEGILFSSFRCNSVGAGKNSTTGAAEDLRSRESAGHSHAFPYGFHATQPESSGRDFSSVARVANLLRAAARSARGCVRSGYRDEARKLVSCDSAGEASSAALSQAIALENLVPLLGKFLRHAIPPSLAHPPSKPLP